MKANKDIHTLKEGGSTRLALTRREAAQALSISVESLDKAVARNLIAPVRVFRRVLFDVRELRRFLEANTDTLK